VPVGTSVRVITKVLKMKKMSTYGKGSEDAVSPVIGVILMVAITVILAAVIAAFVFGMAGNVSKTRNIALTAQKVGSGSIIITNNGGADSGDVSLFGVSINGADAGTLTSLISTVGSTQTFGGTSGTKDHVIVTATFNDGTKQVVLDTNV
jgi:archaeal type IV pilus assembly protein PilA